MEILFKVTSLTPATPPQVSDTNFQEHYSGVNASMAWDELTPAVRQATEKFVLPYIGSALYDDLAQKFNGTDPLEDYEERAIELLQDCIAYYTIYHVLPEKNTVLASLGTVQQEPQGGSMPAPQWGWKAKRWSALENGDTFLDRLLQYLEQQVSDNVSYFDLWANSTAYKVKTSDFFRSTTQLDEYLNIQNSRRSFISIVRFIKQVEEDMIKPVLCDDLYAAVLDADPSDNNKKLLPMIRKAVAYLGAAEAIPHHRIVIDGDGFRVVSQTDQFDDRRNLTNPTHESAIQALHQRCEDQGKKALAKLVKFLEDNLTDYPDYADSDCRTTPAVNRHSIVDSSSGRGAMGLF